MEPLALWLMIQQPHGDPVKEAEKYIDPEKEVPDAETALAGARDILAESVSDDAALRKELENSILRTMAKHANGSNDYFLQITKGFLKLRDG